MVYLYNSTSNFLLVSLSNYTHIYMIKCICRFMFFQTRIRLDLYHLSSSKYDEQIPPSIVHPHENAGNNHTNNISDSSSRNKKEIGGGGVDDRFKYQRQKAEALSVPLDWQRWKGPFAGYGKNEVGNNDNAIYICVCVSTLYI